MMKKVKTNYMNVIMSPECGNISWIRRQQAPQDSLELSNHTTWCHVHNDSNLCDRLQILSL